MNPTRSALVLTIVGCLSFFHPSNSFGKGGVSDGGGSGMACFYTWDIMKDSLQKLIDSHGRLNPEFRDRMTQLDSTDFRESPVASIKPLQDETPSQYLTRVIENNVQPFSPQFAKMLTAAIKNIKFSEWQALNGLDAIDDIGETLELKNYLRDNKYCLPVQIAKRSEVKNEEGLYFSKVLSIQYDQELFEKLKTHDTLKEGIVQQAFLILHEALYSIAYQNGQENSVFSRSMARFIMHSGTAFQSKSNLDFLAVLKINGFLTPSLFGYRSENKNTNSFERLMAYQKLIDRLLIYYGHYISKLRTDLGRSEDQKSNSSQSPFWPYKSQFLMSWDRFLLPELDQLTDVEAFMAALLLGRNQETASNIESLLTADFQNQRFLKEKCRDFSDIKKTFYKDFIAIKMDTSEEYRQQLQKLSDKAVRYCERL